MSFPTCLHKKPQIHICPKALSQSSLRDPDESKKSVNAHPHCLDSVSHSSPHLVLHGLIDGVDQPGESLPVDGFGQGVSGIDGMIDREWGEDLRSKTKSQLKSKTYMEK